MGGFDGLDGFDDFDDLEGFFEDDKFKKKLKKIKKIKDFEFFFFIVIFVFFVEFEFFILKYKFKKFIFDEFDFFGDFIGFIDVDVFDKFVCKCFLVFYIFKINVIFVRCVEGRVNRMGGDEDVLYRDRRKVRDDVFKWNSVCLEGEDLEEVWLEKEKKKRVRDEIEDDGEGVVEDDEVDGYYELVKRRRKDEKWVKEVEYEVIEK